MGQHRTEEQEQDYAEQRAEELALREGSLYECDDCSALIPHGSDHVCDTERETCGHTRVRDGLGLSEDVCLDCGRALPCEAEHAPLPRCPSCGMSTTTGRPECVRCRLEMGVVR